MRQPEIQRRDADLSFLIRSQLFQSTSRRRFVKVKLSERPQARARARSVGVLVAAGVCLMPRDIHSLRLKLTNFVRAR